MCIIRDVSLVEDYSVQERLSRTIHIDGDLEELSVGAAYPIFAIERRDGGVWLYLQAEPAHAYPAPYPIELFNLIETNIPNGWEVEFRPHDEGVGLHRLSFSEWAHDDGFYERLVDGEERAQACYERARRQEI